MIDFYLVVLYFLDGISGSAYPEHQMHVQKIVSKRQADLNHVMNDCANNPMIAQASNTMMDYFVHVRKKL